MNALHSLRAGLKRTDEFRQDAVRIALTSGLTRKQVADDLGVGMSTLNKWITAHRDTDVVSREDLSLAQENDRLRRENRLLKEEREIVKKATCQPTGDAGIAVRPVLRGPKAMRFRFVEEHSTDFPATRLCHVVGVSPRGLRAFRSRPASHRQRSDLVTPAHIKEQSRLSLGSYGRPWMTEELKEIGLKVGHPLPAGDCMQSPRGPRGPSDAPEQHISYENPQTQGHD